MISFYPGPSRIYDEVPKYVKEAHKQGILSMNHRSDEFMKMNERTIKLLKQKLNIPKNYTVFYTSSATECWEIIAQSLITDTSHHLYSGSFGEKWYKYTKKICSGAKNYPFHRNDVPDPATLRFEGPQSIVCLTQNETSNGTQVSNAVIKKIKQDHPGHLIAVDATSSMAGVTLNFEAADIWLASVQKCFGLPAGLGLMVCSPRTIERAKAIGEKAHYNSLTFMNDMAGKWQTAYTPNVLGIYLLMRVMEAADPIKEVHARTLERYGQWMEFLNRKSTFKHLIQNKDVQSFTVIPVEASEEIVAKVKAKAKKNGILLGEGYGELKSTTFRIANFPALKKNEIRILQEFLSAYK